MNRIGCREPISEALELLSPTMQERVKCDWLTGCDPLFVGLHRFTTTDFEASYADVAHCVYDFHQEDTVMRSDRATTVVIPYVTSRAVVIHELGHVLHENIGFDHVPHAVSDYAETHNWEAFAEAFTLWADPEGSFDLRKYRPDVLAQDKETLALFAELSR